MTATVKDRYTVSPALIAMIKEARLSDADLIPIVKSETDCSDEAAQRIIDILRGEKSKSTPRMQSFPELIGSGNPEAHDHAAGLSKETINAGYKAADAAMKEAFIKPAMTMVEKVARALAFCAGSRFAGPGQCVATREFGWSGDGKYLEQYAEAHWKEHRSAAMFAITAMREPTAAMWSAGDRLVLPSAGDFATDTTAVWQAMIDVALKEAP